MILKKEWIAMFPKLALTEICQERLDLTKNRVSLAFKETRSAPDIYWKLPYQRVRNLHYQHTSVDQTKPHRVIFSISIALVFLSFSYFVFACTFFTLHFVKHKEKHPKCKRICKLLSSYYFLRSG